MLLNSPELSSLLDGAELAYLAVESASGPMVTPVLFTVQDGRIWSVVPRSSAKVGAIGRNKTVGVALGTPTAMAVVQGEAHLVDPMRPQSLVSSLPEAVLSPRALGSYVVGNLDHLAGLIGPGALAPRTAVAIRPQRALAVRDGAPLWSSGTWPPGAEPYEGTGAVPLLRLTADVPATLAALTGAAGPVLVGWTTASGPVVLPGRWDPEHRVATVREDVFRGAGCLPQARACVLFDGTEGTRLDGKTGLVLRGRGSARRGSGGAADLVLRVERLSWWEGDDAHTAKAG